MEYKIVMESIDKYVQDNYGIKVTQEEKIKNVYKIRSGNRFYCLKIIKYEFQHFNFIVSAIEHLINKGFNKIPPIITTLKGEKYIPINNNYAYLTSWVNARESNYDNPYDLYLAIITLAELHKCSEGFTLNKNMKPRVGWFRWISNFETRTNEILDFKNRISQKAKKSEFDVIYLSLMDKELKIAESAINNLKNSNYLSVMNKEFFKRGFCHHDFAHHNVLIDSHSNVNVIDFDYCILDSYLHDLSSLMLRSMKNGKWELEKAKFILNNYSNIKDVEDEHIPLMAAFMEFPQDYWQVGLQYYWEQQNWEEKFFVSKLKKIKEDLEDKEDFINEFKLYKLNGG